MSSRTHAVDGTPVAGRLLSMAAASEADTGEATFDGGTIPTDIKHTDTVMTEEGTNTSHTHDAFELLSCACV